MKPGRQTLDDVLAHARSHTANLAAEFDCAVLLVVTDELATSTVTAVTSPGNKRPPPTGAPAAPTTWVVPILPRYTVADPGKLSFGRSDVCDIVLPFSQVSKHHGFFQLSGPDWYAVDVGSTNGTVVDGKKSNLTTPVRLSEGCTLHLGKVTARFLSPLGFVQVLRQRLELG